MIYFDNAATTIAKPFEVVEAVVEAMRSFGGPGRGAHEASMAANEALYQARCRAAELFDVADASRVAFTANATMALNVAVAGLLAEGGRAVTTAASHNSVLRPLYKARDERGCSLRIVPVSPDASLPFDDYERTLSQGADVVVATHASNVTGDVYDVAAMARLAHDAGALFILDAAQTAGSLPLSLEATGADVVCFTGHKGLMGPQGTGGLCVAEGVDVLPLLEGGSGVRSFDERHPRFMPDALEAGTANAHGIAGLAAGMAYLERRGIGALAGRVAALTTYFRDGLDDIAAVRVHGGKNPAARCGIVSLNIEGMDAAFVSARLSSEYGICTRAGVHCAPLMHEALGTHDCGSVRFSFSSANTVEEADAALKALRVLASEAGR